MLSHPCEFQRSTQLLLCGTQDPRRLQHVEEGRLEVRIETFKKPLTTILVENENEMVQCKRMYATCREECVKTQTVLVTDGTYITCAYYALDGAGGICQMNCLILQVVQPSSY